ncbi:hypothetical protein HAX54_024726, partial [Datura stramonium]|nr:hypothetical protein [Datura stramonium]
LPRRSAACVAGLPHCAVPCGARPCGLSQIAGGYRRFSGLSTDDHDLLSSLVYSQRSSNGSRVGTGVSPIGSPMLPKLLGVLFKADGSPPPHR